MTNTYRQGKQASPSHLATVLSLLAFPLIVFGCPLLGYVMFLSTNELFLASLCATSAVVALTIIFELIIPYRDDWRIDFSPQSAKDTRLNIIYMGSSFFFQGFIVKPILIALLVPTLVYVSSLLSVSTEQAVTWWPYHWHWFYQVTLLLLVSDLINYWVHRCLHEWHHGWAMHKLHHSLSQLNWSASPKSHVLVVCI